MNADYTIATRTGRKTTVIAQVTSHTIQPDADAALAERARRAKEIQEEASRVPMPVDLYVAVQEGRVSWRHALREQRERAVEARTTPAGQLALRNVLCDGDCPSDFGRKLFTVYRDKDGSRVVWEGRR